jgi:hypothetical protein
MTLAPLLIRYRAVAVWLFAVAAVATVAAAIQHSGSPPPQSRPAPPVVRIVVSYVPTPVPTTSPVYITTASQPPASANAAPPPPVVGAPVPTGPQRSPRNPANGLVSPCIIEQNRNDLRRPCVAVSGRASAAATGGSPIPFAVIVLLPVPLVAGIIRRRRRATRRGCTPADHRTTRVRHFVRSINHY